MYYFIYIKHTKRERERERERERKDWTVSCELFFFSSGVISNAERNANSLLENAFSARSFASSS